MTKRKKTATGIFCTERKEGVFWPEFVSEDEKGDFWPDSLPAPSERDMISKYVGKSVRRGRKFWPEFVSKNEKEDFFGQISFPGTKKGKILARFCGSVLGKRHDFKVCWQKRTPRPKILARVRFQERKKGNFWRNFYPVTKRKKFQYRFLSKGIKI
ncbi:hypothetical protein KKF34_10130 [Myxococcota bacterium]|nr:hypothetical protein [Myxococcota bacterium]MBU1381219.1 hypothetical protein [Myxococcota bacterium]MBU1497224.1 hypothetical protein [Myxococcota bacterium]